MTGRLVSIPRTGFINWKAFYLWNCQAFFEFQSRERVSLIGKKTPKQQLNINWGVSIPRTGFINWKVPVICLSH